MIASLSVGNSRAGSKRISFNCLARALGFSIEIANGVDFVIKQVYSKWLVASHRKKVDDAAAHREFAVAHYLTNMQVAGLLEVTSELISI